MGEHLAVVTGGTRGIGRAVTERLVARGMTVVAIGRSDAGLRDVADTGAIPVALDVADPRAVTRVFDEIHTSYGVPDLLVNNAGISGGTGYTWQLPADEWWQVVTVNLHGTYLCARAVIEPMMARGGGRIINMSSGAGSYALGLENDGLLNSAYMASKAAVNRFTEALASESYAAGVRVFAMSPGMVKTDMTAAVFVEEWDDPDTWTPMEKAVDLIVDIDSGMLDALTGRYLRAAVDDWRALAARADDVLAQDANVLRISELRD